MIMAALEHRDRTGEGQHIDFAQLEAALHFLAPELLDEEINGRTAGRHGNADRHMSPHAVYPALGDDRWVAIACESDDHWQELCGLLRTERLAHLDVVARRGMADEIDELISAWTSALDPSEAQARLQAVGIPSHMVNTAADLVADPQILARNHFQRVPHPVHGTTWVEAANWTMSRTPSRIDWGGPTFGQHNMEVLEGILGYDEDRIAELVIAGAIA
jgi:benzylsuccinate CoA-transferase BbsF subunit